MTLIRNTGKMRRTATRQDLLLVGQDTVTGPADPETTLRGMGFRLQQKHPGHWVLTTAGPLPELHFYSRKELGRFATDRAPNYLVQTILTHNNRSEHHADTAHLPG